MADIDEILKKHRATAEPEPQAEDGDKFFSVLVGDGLEENFLELQLRNGMRTCFSYSDLMWFNLDPEAGCLDLEFGGFLVTIKGRGLAPKLFNGIKGKRVAWVKEADSPDMQDHHSNPTFIGEITITPPKDGAEGQETAGE